MKWTIVKVEIFPEVNEAGERVWRVVRHFRLPSGKPVSIPDMRRFATNAEALAAVALLLKNSD